MGLLLPPLLSLLLFEEAGFYPHREGNGFPLFESCEDVKIRKTDNRSFPPFRAMMNRNSKSTICQNSYKTFRSIH